jgi:hypothetical protein
MSRIPGKLPKLPFTGRKKENRLILFANILGDFWLFTSDLRRFFGNSGHKIAIKSMQIGCSIC